MNRPGLAGERFGRRRLPGLGHVLGLTTVVALPRSCCGGSAPPTPRASLAELARVSSACTGYLVEAPGGLDGCRQYLRRVSPSRATIDAGAYEHGAVSGLGVAVRYVVSTIFLLGDGEVFVWLCSGS